ncbi:MAG: class I SAM-dependent methyltransferase [Actinomycetota bacterium]|nr:class I SAM-dependent methyltransferase [Actinomycetota bacterium]
MPPDTLASAGADDCPRAAPGTRLPITGERTVPGVAHENYWFRRHEAVYRVLAPYAEGAVVLEAGCGEGYGADLLTAAAARVLAVDRDAQTVRHAAGAYPRLDVLRADLQRLPLGDASVGVVITLQVIEHLHDQAGFVRECTRVLVPGGLLVMSTPNRLTFSPGLDAPINPFHTRELAPAELDGLLTPFLDVVQIKGLRHGSALLAWEAAHGPIMDAQLAGPPDGWPAAVSQRVAAVTVDDFEIDAGEIDTALDLVAVARRRR